MTSGLTNVGLTNHATGGDSAAPGSGAVIADAAALDLNVLENADSWRVEVAARLERYRTRRKPRTPHYPSLLLPFDAPESWSRPAPPTGLAGTGSTGHWFTGNWFTGNWSGGSCDSASACRAKLRVPCPARAEGRRGDKLRRTFARRRRQAQTDIRSRSRNHSRRNHPRRSSSSHVPPPFRCFTAANWPIPSSIMIVRASWKPRKFCRRHRHWVEC